MTLIISGKEFQARRRQNSVLLFDEAGLFAAAIRLNTVNAIFVTATKYKVKSVRYMHGLCSLDAQRLGISQMTVREQDAEAMRIFKISDGSAGVA